MSGEENVPKLNEETIEEETQFAREEMSYISGEYLSAAASMVAWQFIDRPESDWPADANYFAEVACELMRQHCPIAYMYFYQNSSGDFPLPTGTLDIILQNVRAEKPTFLGGNANGDIVINS